MCDKVELKVISLETKKHRQSRCFFVTHYRRCGLYVYRTSKGGVMDGKCFCSEVRVSIEEFSPQGNGKFTIKTRCPVCQTTAEYKHWPLSDEEVDFLSKQIVFKS